MAVRGRSCLVPPGVVAGVNTSNAVVLLDDAAGEATHT